MNELAHLVARCYRDGVDRADAQGWNVELAARGFNGIVYRAQSDGRDLAVKVSRIDERDRAGRELAALTRLRAYGVEVVPEVLGLVREPEGVPVAVVLLRWRSGTVVTDPPAPQSPFWERLVSALAQIHRPGSLDGPPLRDGVLGVSIEQVAGDMRRRSAGDVSSESLIALAERSARSSLPPARRSLIHCDANLRNVLVDDAGAVTVLDWENSGWGDPCFDLGDLLASPQLLDRDSDHLEPLVDMHAELLGDARFAARTRAYARLMVAWWVVRLRQELRAPTPRLEGVHRPDERSRRELLTTYEAWAEALFA